MAKSNGYILFEGPSALDGDPIVVIATGLKSASSNRKTGGMVQTYILRSDVTPVEAVKTGADSAICGDCPHRGDGFKARTCYVNVGQGAMSVFKAYKRGSYPRWHGDLEPFTDKPIRFGTYGDPAAAPLHIWKGLQSVASMTTGYTHQWRHIAPEWAQVVMASADTIGDMSYAQDMGYRTFRVSPNIGKMPGEVLCPASDEAGKKLTCDQCGACNGTATGRKGSIMIPLHGSNSGDKGKADLASRLIARG